MSKALAYSTKNLSVGSLGSYIQWVNRIPLLSKEEEIELANRFREMNDLEAARKLVLSHLRFVVRLARNYSGYGLQQADLIQEGNIGLMKAVKRFDPQMGVRLVSFAVHWVRAEIHEFILKNWRIVKIATTKAQRKLFFNLRKAATQMGWFSEGEIAAMANELNVSKNDVRQMEARLKSYDQSLESSDDDEESGWTAPVHYLEDHSHTPAQALELTDWDDKQKNLLSRALDQLDPRSKDILYHRWLNEEKQTLHELAERYGVSAERIRQLEKNAMNKIKEFACSQRRM